MLKVDTAGLHPSTALCLEAMQHIQEYDYFENILDMGCGNAILAVIAASIWDARAVAADISEKAITDAQEHIARNRLESHITLVRSDGFAHPAIRSHAPYQLIICNWIAQQLIEAAPHFRSLADVQGYCILGGVLSWLAEPVITAYTTLGFTVEKQWENSPWQAYLLKFPSVTKA